MQPTVSHSTPNGPAPTAVADHFALPVAVPTRAKPSVGQLTEEALQL
jgi:hypothetical protein